jgi:HSP20 family protein
MTESNTRWRVPAVDVYESDASWRLVADMPHVDKSDLDITVHDGVLKLEAQSEGTGYRRSFRLPRGVRSESVAATLEHGVLTLELPKPEEARPQRIAIA